MDVTTIYFITYCLVSLLGSFMWIYYFKLIDVFEPEKFWHLLVSFSLGLASPIILIAIYPLIENLGLYSEDHLYQTLIENFILAGLLEEFLKAFTFLCAFGLIKKSIHEPIDYLIHICLCALGFSATENLLYFSNHGAAIIDFRFIFSTFGHIFNSSVFAYGLIYGLYKTQKHVMLNAFSFLLIAAIFHGVFNFLLSYEFTGHLLVFGLYFFLLVSIFSTTLNNALNNSSLFSYKKLIYPDPIFLRMMLLYCALLLVKTILLFFQFSLKHALSSLFSSFIISLPIVLIVFQRISRFTLIKNHWRDFKLELPFTSITYFSETGIATKFVVKGHGQTETFLGSFLGTKNLLCPVSERTTWFENEPEIEVSHKLFLNEYSIFYRIKIHDHNIDDIQN